MEKAAELKIVTPKDASKPNPENVVEEPATGTMSVADGDPEVTGLYSGRVVDRADASKADTLGRPLPINTHSEVEGMLGNVDKTATLWSESFFTPGINNKDLTQSDKDLLSGLYS